jgi:transcriptional regulator with XRE-family HTH domain
MHIPTEKEITGVVAKQLREDAGLTQKEFWCPLGLTQSGGSRYEQGKAIPMPTRILIFAAYVAGIRLNASTAAGAAQLVRLAKLQSSECAANQEAIGDKWAEATTMMRRTATLLSDIATLGAGGTASLDVSQS